MTEISMRLGALSRVINAGLKLAGQTVEVGALWRTQDGGFVHFDRLLEEPALEERLADRLGWGALCWGLENGLHITFLEGQEAVR
jgi:hypothetical protein